MHALDINLLKHHLRNLFRLSLKVKMGGDGLSVPSVFKHHNIKPTELNQCKRLVVENNCGLLYELLGYHRSVLYVISSDLKIMGEAVVLGMKWILAKNIAHWNEEDPAVIALCAETNASGNDARANVGADIDDNPDTEHADAEVDHADGGDNNVDAAAAAKEAKLITALRIIITSIEEDKVVQIPDRVGITLSIMETICQLIDVDHTSITDVSKKALLARKLRDECERLDEDALSAIFREGSREPSVANREEEASNAKAIRNTVKAILACGAENDKWINLP
ncbi:hypothetical protein BDN71DRAFT_1511979 [Pleurotus eryngii]|uniref:Uncharacterized protein n=1 Tax=Pleurotus eryngii TaxID=5323 RepID=A0A9P5ZNL3_PLEER|nr:hypothetical protein BDN71DRAFT_1511979 [Pleurotus eryngii]